MRRYVGLFSVVGVLLPLVFAASASAQGANLDVSPRVASPGQVVTVTGSGYTQTGGGLSGASIRLSRRNGIELANEPVDTAGRIEASFPVPQGLAPGWYLLIATQIVEANNRQKSFTPGRTRLRVVAAAKGAAGAAPPSSGGGGLPGDPGWMTAGAIALALLAAGSTLVARRRWTHNRQPLGS